MRLFLPDNLQMLFFFLRLFGERLQPRPSTAKGETAGRRIRRPQCRSSFLFPFNDATFTSLSKRRYAAGSFCSPLLVTTLPKFYSTFCEVLFLAWWRSLWWSGAASLTLFSFHLLPPQRSCTLPSFLCCQLFFPFSHPRPSASPPPTFSFTSSLFSLEQENLSGLPAKQRHWPLCRLPCSIFL